MCGWQSFCGLLIVGTRALLTSALHGLLMPKTDTGRSDRHEAVFQQYSSRPAISGIQTPQLSVHASYFALVALAEAYTCTKLTSQHLSDPKNMCGRKSSSQPQHGPQLSLSVIAGDATLFHSKDPQACNLPVT